MILRIQCPACERQFKVGDELVGRMVECGACEHRFRLDQNAVIPEREKFYPGDFKRPGLSGASRTPIGEAGPVQFESIEYQNTATAADVSPLSPQRLVATSFGIVTIAFGIGIYLLGSRQNAWLQDVPMEKRLILATFIAISGAGLVLWGSRFRKLGIASAVGLAAALMVTAAMVPVRVTQRPGGTTVEAIETGEDDPRTSPIDFGTNGRLSSEEMMRRVGFGPIKRAVQAQTTADRDGRDRVAAIWVEGMRERFKFQVVRYLQRVLKTKERPSFYARRDGGLFVIEGVEMSLQEFPVMFESTEG